MLRPTRRVSPVRRRLLGGLTIVALLAGGLVTTASTAGAATVTPTGVRAFSSLYSVNTTGNILLRGNTLMTCPAGATGTMFPPAGNADISCATAQGAGSWGRDNDFNMAYVNTDPAAVTAGYVDSSSANVTIPGGATVIRAYLLWSGQVTGTGPTFSSTIYTSEFKAPGAAYALETSGHLDSTAITGGIAYQGIVNVTTAVQSGGSGTYTVANVQSIPGSDNYAGWALAIAYEDPTQPERNLNIYSGLQNVNSAAGSNNLAISLNGFTTPATGSVMTEVGVVGWEGDRGNVGDGMTVGSTSMSNAVNPVNDIFNSTLSDLGTPITDGNPSYQNTLGTDIDTFSATGALADGATSTTVAMTTSASGGETYYPGLLSFATTLNAPSLTATKTVNDVTNNTVSSGDQLKYAVAVQNRGTDGAAAVVLTDTLPSGVSYVGGSMTINGAAVTDRSDSDDGAVSGSTVTAQLGAGATSSTGGQLAVGGPTTTVTFAVTVTPAAHGTIISNTANLTYTDATTGVAFVGASDTATSTIGGPTLAFASPPAGQQTVAYTDTLPGNGGSTPYTWSLTAGTLPAGITFSSGGLLSGTPTAAGTSEFTVLITDASGYIASEATSLTIAGLGLMTAAPPAGEATAPYTDTLAAVGGTGPYTYAVTSGALPLGLMLSSTVVISGRPTAAAVGTASFTVTVTDSVSATASGQASIVVVAGPVLATVPPSGEVSAVYTATLAAAGGARPYSYAVTAGSLPAGLALSASGALTGTPSAAGTTSLTVTATDAIGGFAADLISLAVNPPPTLTFGAPPAAEKGVAYVDQLTETGGVGPFIYAVVSGLPTGINITSGGLLSGTPTVSGTYPLTVRITDANAESSTLATSVMVITGPVLAFTPPSGEVGVAYTATFAATGGTGPYTYVVTTGSVPAGLTFADGVLSGTPTDAGVVIFSLTATDSKGQIAADPFTITVVTGPVLVSATPPAEAIQTPFSYSLSASGGTTPYEWMVSVGSLPSGVTLGFGSGVLSGTPSVTGTFPITVEVTDAGGQSATEPITLVVNPAAALTASSSSVNFGTTVTFTATIAPLTATGTVTFSDLLASGSTASLGSATLSSGIATLTLALPSFNLNTVTATYSGIPSVAIPVQVNGYQGEVIVNELRLSGPGGPTDQYVELYNTGPAVPLAGFRIQGSSGGSVTLPTSAPTLPTGHSYLVTDTGHSLAAIAASDATDSNLGSSGVQVAAPDSAGTAVDAVGSTVASPGFFSGTGLPAMTGSPTDQYAWVRIEKSGVPVNTSNNATDFKLVSTTGGVVGGVQSTLGSPAPRATGSPTQSNGVLLSSLLDTTKAANVAPNFVHVHTPINLLTLRRTITNSSGSTITSALIRITSLSEANGLPEPGVATQPASVALLRLTDPLTATSQVVTAAGTVTVQNLSVDVPASTGDEGGLNTTLTIPLSGGLAPGATVHVAFTFDVDRAGTYWFGYDVDALTAPTSAVEASPTALQLQQFAILAGQDAAPRSTPAGSPFDRNGGRGQLR